MIDLANPKTPLDSAKIAGYMAFMSGRVSGVGYDFDRNCPFLSGAHADAYKAGILLAKSHPRIEKGVMFDLGHYSGISCSVCFDDIEIGDSVVVICKMYGLLVRSADHKPELVRGDLTKINGVGSGVLYFRDEHAQDSAFKISGLGGQRGQTYALRYIG